MDKTASNETSLNADCSFAVKNAQEDLEVTQHNSSIVHEFAKLNIEKASNKIDRKAMTMFNVFVKSS